MPDSQLLKRRANYNYICKSCSKVIPKGSKRYTDGYNTTNWHITCYIDILRFITSKVLQDSMYDQMLEMALKENPPETLVAEYLETQSANI